MSLVPKKYVIQINENDETHFRNHAQYILKYKLLFVHIPKCAGKTIDKAITVLQKKITITKT